MKNIFFLLVLLVIIFSCVESKKIGVGFGKEVIPPKPPEPEYKVVTKKLFDTTNISQNVVQFWTQSRIVLVKQEKGNTAQVLPGGKIDLAKVEKNDTVTIEANTPVVCESVSQGNLKISFDDSGNFLTFSPGSDENQTYFLKPDVMKDNMFFINYDGESYRLTEGNNSSLKIDLSSRNFKDGKKKVISKGRKIN